MIIDWSDASLQDLEELHAYIAERNPAAAARQLQRIYARVYQLEHHPHMGRIGRCFGTRELVIGKSSYIVAYRIRRNAIEILRILHEKRRWPGTL